MVGQQFEQDWKRLAAKQRFGGFVEREAKKSAAAEGRAGGPPAAGEELAQVKEGLRRCFAEVGRSFSYFSLLGSGDVFNMQLNEYSDFLVGR